LRFGLTVSANSSQSDNSVHAGAKFLNRPAFASAAALRQHIDNFVNQETRSDRSDWSLFIFVIRKRLNQRSLWYRAPTQSLGDCIA
jgi:hypothetical protein